MSDDTTTTERPPMPKQGHGGPVSADAACGTVFMQPNPLALNSAVYYEIDPATHAKTQMIRYSVDNYVGFVPPPGSPCDYWFIQSVERTTTQLDANGNDTGNKVPAMSHEWQPDIAGWSKTKKKFLDPKELAYDPKLVERQKKPRALRRRDGPGYSTPRNNPAKSLKMHWNFKTFIICDCPDGLKLAALVEFSFDVLIDKNGKPSLQSVKTQATTFCCQFNDDFYEWIDQWHAHTPLASGSGEKKSLREYYSAIPKLIDEALRARKAFEKLSSPGTPAPQRRKSRAR